MSVEEIEREVNDITHYYIAPVKAYQYMKTLIYEIHTLEEKVEKIEVDLKFNASMLAKQCDLARDAETERERLSKLLIEERMRVVALRDTIGKHEAFKRTHEKVVGLEDEELYRVLKEMKGE